MDEEFETFVRRVARQMPYPTSSRPLRHSKQVTINTQRLLRFAAVAIALVAIVSFTVPEIRATIATFLRFGAVTIYLEGRSEQGELLKLDDVAGETTLKAVQEAVDFPLLFPPENPPHRAFVQGENLVIFVWVSGENIDFALYQAAGRDWQIVKSASEVVETDVNEHPAYWIQIQHPVHFLESGVVWTSFVTGNVLGWVENDITYRLETRLSLEEARAFAESLMP